MNEDGSLGAHLSTSTPAPGGVITEIPNPDGTSTRGYTRPDGYTSLEQYITGPDGNPRLAATWNSEGMRSSIDTEGSINTTYPDGRTAKTITLPDGQILTRFSDGSVLGYDPTQAPEGTPQTSTWDVVKSWTGGQLGELKESAIGSAQQHPIANVNGLLASGGHEGVTRYGSSMAGEAATTSGRSQAALQQMITQLEAGDTAAGRSAITAVNSADEAARAGSKAEALMKTGKYGGWVATGAIATYVNVDDMVNHGKGVPEGIGNAVGTTAGGIAGGWAGAEAGALAGTGVGAVFPPAAPISVPAGAIIGAVLGGYVGGTTGGQAGDKAGAAARELFE